jgi:tetratricopeptide (TPR) repeat protein
MKRSFLAALILISVTVLCPLSSQSSDEESLGREAEQAGKLREALTHYVAALQSVSEGSSNDQQLREKIISLVQKITPPPAVPDEARRYAVRGKAAITEAKSASDFEEAAREFSKALRIAPWWAESYFNRAVAQEKAGQLNEAISSLKLYLLAAPNDPDADKVKDQIYALEYKQERAKKDTSAKRQAEEQERQRLAEQKVSAEQLNGRWVVNQGLRHRFDGPYAPCRQSAPDIGALYSIKVRDNQIEIIQLQISTIGCDESWRYPRSPLNLLVFSGTIQNNQITGTMYKNMQKQYSQKKLVDLVASDFFVSESNSFKAEIQWDSGGNSFEMNKAFDDIAGHYDHSQKWERE